MLEALTGVLLADAAGLNVDFILHSTIARRGRNFHVAWNCSTKVLTRAPKTEKPCSLSKAGF